MNKYTTLYLSAFDKVAQDMTIGSRGALPPPLPSAPPPLPSIPPPLPSKSSIPPPLPSAAPSPSRLKGLGSKTVRGGGNLLLYAGLDAAISPATTDPATNAYEESKARKDPMWAQSLNHLRKTLVNSGTYMGIGATMGGVPGATSGGLWSLIDPVIETGSELYKMNKALNERNQAIERGNKIEMDLADQKHKQRLLTGGLKAKNAVNTNRLAGKLE